MIIEIPNENSIVKWKNDDKDEWKVAEISDLIKAYERPQDCSDCKRYDFPYFEVKFEKEQMQELVDKAKAEVLASIEQVEWIPVSERLPNTLGVYNVTRKIIEGETIYFISDACYFDGQNTWHDDTRVNHSRPYLTDVIAWMQRPEPYKKEGEEK